MTRLWDDFKIVVLFAIWMSRQSSVIWSIKSPMSYTICIKIINDWCFQCKFLFTSINNWFYNNQLFVYSSKIFETKKRHRSGPIPKRIFPCIRNKVLERSVESTSIMFSSFFKTTQKAIDTHLSTSCV